MCNFEKSSLFKRFVSFLLHLPLLEAARKAFSFEQGLGRRHRL
jgi:hypothetical protein